MSTHLHLYDIPESLSSGDAIAVDTETMGLNPHRDRLCLVQLSAGDGDAHLVHFPEPNYAAPHLRALLADQGVLKIFHFARFDVAMLKHYLDVDCGPVYCTKIASKLARTYTGGHSLKDLCRELLDIDLSKVQQSSNWGAATLTPAQQGYAASDVLHLHQIRNQLQQMLQRSGRIDLAQACFDFLPHRVALDLAGWPETDIFAHS